MKIIHVVSGAVVSVSDEKAARLGAPDWAPFDGTQKSTPATKVTKPRAKAAPRSRAKAKPAAEVTPEPAPEPDAAAK